MMAKIKVCDISGMGGRENGGYEWGCQVICARALAFMQKCKTEGQFPTYTEFKNITGIAIPDNDKAQEMDDFIIAHPKLHEYGMTGAMHQYGIAHARKIFELGREEYLKQLEPHRTPEDFFDFEYEDAFPAHEAQPA
jgi:hypothetical protein